MQTTETVRHKPREYRPSTGEPTVTISVSVPLHVADWLARTAQKHNTSKSRVAVVALQREMERQEGEEAA